MISPVTTHYGVQEEWHAKVQDPAQQRPGSGIEKYGTEVEGVEWVQWVPDFPRTPPGLFPQKLMSYSGGRRL